MKLMCVKPVFGAGARLLERRDDDSAQDHALTEHENDQRGKRRNHQRRHDHGDAVLLLECGDVELAVARALAGSPSIMLADEPTGNLDSKNGEAVMNLLRDLHRDGATICMVTHDPRYAHYADRTVRLFDGRIVEDEAE